jgi:erythronate-4-phosphate dehydrogenase
LPYVINFYVTCQVLASNIDGVNRKSINFQKKIDNMKIIADDKIPFLKGTLEPFAEVVYAPGKLIDNDMLKDCDAMLIRTRTKCTESLLTGTNVSFIGTATIGFDHIDVHYCNKHNILWTNAPGCNSSSVQQYIAAALLKISAEFKFNLKDKTLGIVGVGNVGSKVEKFARMLGMKVLLNDPPRAREERSKDFSDLDTILSESDIITLHVPLNVVDDDNTYHLFDEESFRKMKNGAWFINSSRGEVMDTKALKKALSAGKLGGAVIDVWENEPDIDAVLLNEAFITTPHIAGYSADGKANGTSVVVNFLSKIFNLPIENWYPKDIPAPASQNILIDCSGKSDEEIIREAVLQTYDIDGDVTRLRRHPLNFEKQRGDYPIRREFSSYTVNLVKETKKIREMLKTLGFNFAGN